MLSEREKFYGVLATIIICTGLITTCEINAPSSGRSTTAPRLSDREKCIMKEYSETPYCLAIAERMRNPKP